MPSAGEHPPRDVCYNGFPSPAYSQKRRPRNLFTLPPPTPLPPMHPRTLPSVQQGM